MFNIRVCRDCNSGVLERLLQEDGTWEGDWTCPRCDLRPAAGLPAPVDSDGDPSPATQEDHDAA